MQSGQHRQLADLLEPDDRNSRMHPWRLAFPRLAWCGRTRFRRTGSACFGVMDLSTGFQACRFAIGSRNIDDKSFRLSCTVGPSLCL